MTAPPAKRAKGGAPPPPPPPPPRGAGGTVASGVAVGAATRGSVSLRGGTPALLLRGCRVLHVTLREGAPGREAAVSVSAPSNVLVKDGDVVGVWRETGDGAPDLPRNLVNVQCGGLLLMPGLLDAHVHVTASSVDLRQPASLPASLVTARAVPILSGMLHRGFTTVRDCGGADHGLAQAVAEGTLEGPTLLFCGKALSQTGGHGDFRLAGEDALPTCRGCCADSTIGRVCDGEAACRAAARDEIRKGATHIKVMASGGVSSPTDRLTNLQFSEGELRAIVDEASNAGLYVCAHAYTAAAVRRAVLCGVRSVEHGNLADREAIMRMRERGTFLVPTLITYQRLVEEGEAAGMPAALVAKAGGLVDEGLRALGLADGIGVPVCYGSDCLGTMHVHQAGGISLHMRVQTPAAVLAALTVSPARLFGKEGRVGTVRVGAAADLLLVDGDIAAHPELLADPRRLRLIVKGGRVVKDADGRSGTCAVV